MLVYIINIIKPLKYYLVIFICVTLYNKAVSNNILPHNVNNNELLKQNHSGFIENKGQFADSKGNLLPDILFRTFFNGTEVYITTDGLTYIFQKRTSQINIPANYSNRNYTSVNTVQDGIKEKDSIEWCRFDMVIKDAQIKKENIIKEYPLQDYNNYYFPHCPDGILNVKTYKKIIIKDIYRGIDWVLYAGNDDLNSINGIKHDFVINPGADPEDIQLLYKGAINDIIIKNDRKHICIKTPLGEINEEGLYCYENNSKKEVSSYYKLSGNKVGFHIDEYDPQQTLIIDPVLVWATYYGADYFDIPYSIDSDNSGNIYITGSTDSQFFPVYDQGGDSWYQGYLYTPGCKDIFILKFNKSGVRQWASYYGGGYDGETMEEGLSIATDNSGNVFITGYTDATNFPVYDPGGGAWFEETGGMIILKFDPLGVRQWATHFADDCLATGTSITTDNSGNVFVTGNVDISGNDFPVYDPGGGAWYQESIAGQNDLFILKFSNSGVRLWATLYGGNDNDDGKSIIADSSGNIFITGYTFSADFPTYNPGGGVWYQDDIAGEKDAFILKFSNSGVRQWATYYGGSYYDIGHSITTDSICNIIISGVTTSYNLPTYDQGGGAYHNGNNSGETDIFILKFNNSGIRQWATYYGGSYYDEMDFYSDRAICTDPSGNIYATFGTASDDIPVFSQPQSCSYFDGSYGYGSNIFIVKFTASGIRKWATYYGNGISGTGICPVNKSIFVVSHAGGGENITLNPGGGAFYQSASGFAPDLFIMKFDPSDLNINIGDIDNLCFGEQTGSIDISVTGGTEPYSYLWNNNAIQEDLDSLYAGSYSVTVTDANDCTVSGSATIEEPPQLSVVFTPDDTICIEQSTTISALVNGGTPGYSYLWDNGSTDSSIEVDENDSTVFFITVTDTNGCTVTGNIAVNIFPPLLIDLVITDDSICLGDEISIEINAYGGTGGPYNYMMDGGIVDTIFVDNPEQTHIYNIYVSDGCSEKNDSIKVEVLSQPYLYIDKSDILCYGEQTGSIDLSVTGGTEPYSYLWNNNAIQEDLDSLLAGSYSVTVTDANGCTVSGSATIGEPPQLSVVFTPDDTICIEQLTTISALVNGGTPVYSYLWDNGSTDSSIEVDENDSTVFFVTVTDTNGCTVTENLAINIFSPEFNIYSDISKGCVPLEVHFFEYGSEYGDSLLWNFGDGDYSDQSTTDNIYDTIGIFFASLTVMDNNSCSNIKYLEIQVIDCDTIDHCNNIFIPNIFSPNNDGKNDILYVLGSGFTINIFVIYDRWGNKVFETNDVNQGWDGTNNNKTLNTAVFVYYLEATCNENGETIIKNGNVTLVR